MEQWHVLSEPCHRKLSGIIDPTGNLLCFRSNDAAAAFQLDLTQTNQHQGFKRLEPGGRLWSTKVSVSVRVHLLAVCAHSLPQNLFYLLSSCIEVNGIWWGCFIKASNGSGSVMRFNKRGLQAAAHCPRPKPLKAREEANTHSVRPRDDNTAASVTQQVVITMFLEVFCSYPHWDLCFNSSRSDGVRVSPQSKDPWFLQQVPFSHRAGEFR